MPHFSLSAPDVRYKSSYLSYARELIAEGRSVEWKPSLLARYFEDFVAMLHDKARDPAPGMAPQSDFWLIVDEAVMGRCSVRHRLDASLERYGGHIGYDVRPSARRRGYGTIQCRLALQEAQRLGLQRALITCDDDNLGSIRIIEACGGVLQDKVDNGRRVLTRRYWVDCESGGGASGAL